MLLSGGTSTVLPTYSAAGGCRIWPDPDCSSTIYRTRKQMASSPVSSSFTLGCKPFEALKLIPQRSCFSLKFKKTRLSAVCCEHSCFKGRDLIYQPPGTRINLLNGVNFSLPERRFGLIFGRSGSGKTTLLQLIAGLSKPTSGSIFTQRYSDEGTPNQSPQVLSPKRVGLVFQFPERYFVADNVLDEVTFGWPRQKGGPILKELLASRLQRAITSVGLNGISLDKNPHSLSGGYKRRLALAIQLVQSPDLLVLDEPLAGLDWKARAEVVKLLESLKNEITILVVSHDLKELASLVDRSWRMEMGGILKEEPLPV